VASIGVNIAIIRSGEILLTLRDDFEVWCMPGGHLDSGETFAQAAVREAREETGLDVTLTRFVGSYSRANWTSGLYHVHLFIAEITGGELCLQTGETLDARFFPLDNVPDNLLVGSRHRIQDVADGLIGVVKTEIINWPFPGLNRQDSYRLRDESGLSPAAFYQQHFPELTAEQIILEVPGTKIV
jgi:8-oxo-dGTP pyrophosphatase MutT (NUDIX family)